MKLRTTAPAILALLAAITIQAAQTSSARMFEAAKKKEIVDGDLNGAIQQYKDIVSKFNHDRAVVADALIRMAESYQKLGDAQAVKVYERLVQEFGDQEEVSAMARQRLAALRPTTAAESLPTARQIWSGLEVSQSGTPSPDGRFLSFAAETGDLGVRDLVTGTSRLLTNTGGWAASGDYVSRSVISPDGRQVAYDWFVEKDFKNELRVIPFAAGDSVRPKVVSRFDRSEYMRPFGWSPDGKRVFVLRFVANANSIGTVSIQDGSFQSIKSLEWRNPNRLSVSGDGGLSHTTLRLPTMYLHATSLYLRPMVAAK
jgi:hypothetical protein